MRRFFTYGPGLLVLLAVTVALVAAPSAVRRVQFARISASVTQAQDTLAQGTLLDRLNEELTAVSDSVLPSVVHLDVRMSPSEGSRFRRTAFTSGTGWIWNDEGFIVTNAHVVNNARRVDAELYDGRVLRARVIGVDIQTDIAVIKIDPGVGVVPITRASNEPLAVGEQVFAFGSPFSIKFSMSRGVVSGLGRSEAASFLRMQGGYTNFIQTDAAMNPGNSGGPLVDVNGRLVGMNAAIANNVDSDGEGLQGQSAGIGFAIPVDTVEAVVSQLIDDESDVVLRGYLGINLTQIDMSADMASRLGYAGPGVLVANTPAGQPAAKGGLERGDIITAINDSPTPTSEVLRSLISIQPPGEPAAITVWRPDNRGSGELIELSVRLGAAYNEGRSLRYIPGSEDMTRTQIYEAIARDREL
ncbi:MAG: trypsin-like peptidase domain-containing protein [Planctomycetota bacterium]